MLLIRLAHQLRPLLQLSLFYRSHLLLRLNQSVQSRQLLDQLRQQDQSRQSRLRLLLR
jgi:hypothetical protein